MASAGAATAVHLENAVQANLPITTNTTSVPEIQCILPDITTPVKPSPVKSSYRHVEIAGFPVDDNPVSQDLGSITGRVVTVLASLSNSTWLLA